MGWGPKKASSSLHRLIIIMVIQNVKKSMFIVAHLFAIVLVWTLKLGVLLVYNYSCNHTYLGTVKPDKLVEAS